MLLAKLCQGQRVPFMAKKVKKKKRQNINAKTKNKINIFCKKNIKNIKVSI